MQYTMYTQSPHIRTLAFKCRGKKISLQIIKCQNHKWLRRKMYIFVYTYIPYIYMYEKEQQSQWNVGGKNKLAGLQCICSHLIFFSDYYFFFASVRVNAHIRLFCIIVKWFAVAAVFFLGKLGLERYGEMRKWARATKSALWKPTKQKSKNQFFVVCGLLVFHSICCFFCP